MNQIIQIVPRLRPTIDGVGDFSLQLAQLLRAKDGIESRFVVGDPSATVSPNPDGFSVCQLASRTTEALVAKISADSTPVLLHYVGYGFAKRGCPEWLVQGIEGWRSHQPTGQLLTIFHELDASGSPWSSAFWLQRLQRQLVRRVARCSTQVVVSTELFADRLRALEPLTAQMTTIAPVFSTVGEPSTDSNWSSRSPRLVIFGSSARRSRVYSGGAELLAEFVQTAGIKQCVDIGPLCPSLPKRIGEIPLEVRGELSPNAIALILEDSQWGAVEYPSPYLAKSTIFAAYAAYGLCPIVIGAGLAPAESDGLVPGREYLVNPLQIPQAAAIAERVNFWYQGHSCSEYAELIGRLLRSAERLQESMRQ